MLPFNIIIFKSQHIADSTRKTECSGIFQECSGVFPHLNTKENGVFQECSRSVPGVFHWISCSYGRNPATKKRQTKVFEPAWFFDVCV